MISKEEKKQLKALANKIQVRYQIGKNELTDSLICVLDNALSARELIKIDVMRGYTNDIMELALDLASQLNAEIIQVLGRVIILYRRNNKHPKILFKK